MGCAAIVIITAPLPEYAPLVLPSGGIPREVVTCEAGFQFPDHSACHTVINRPEDQVDVFRHDHITKNLEPVTLAHRAEVFDKQSPY